MDVGKHMFQVGWIHSSTTYHSPDFSKMDVRGKAMPGRLAIHNVVPVRDSKDETIDQTSEQGDQEVQGSEPWSSFHILPPESAGLHILST